MLILTLVNIAIAIICAFACMYIAFCVFAKIQGDEKIVFLTKKRSKFELYDKNFDKLHLVAKVPYKNKGKQNGTIMDCFARTYLPQEQFSNVSLESWVCDTTKVRHDNYWESVIKEKGQGGIIEVHLLIKAKNGNIRSDIENFPYMNMDIIAQIVGRSDWHMTKSRLVVSPEEIEKALAL